MGGSTTQPREVTDEMLARIGLTRERFEALKIEHEEREARAPNVGDEGPGFELPRLGDRATKVRLADFRDERPVGLIFGSYT